jgi:hypothetical protein
MTKVLFAAGVVAIVAMSTAQTLEVGVDGGYGSGAGTAFVGRNDEADQATWTRVKYEQVYASGGKGVKIMGEVVYFITENMGIMIASGYSMNGGYSTLFRDASGSTRMKTTSRYLPVNAGLKFRSKLGNSIMPYAYVAPGIYFPGKTMDSTSATLDTIHRTYNYTLGFGVAAGIGTEITLPFFSDRATFKVEFAPTYAFAGVTKYTEKVSNAGGTTTTTTFTYKNNTAPEKLGTNELADRPNESFSSIAIRAGLTFKIF